MNSPKNLENILNNVNYDMSENKFEDIEQKIDTFINECRDKFDKLDDKLNKLLTIFEKDISNSCQKMSGHIDFVENVYTTVKAPLTYVCSKINGLTGGDDNLQLEDVHYNLE